MLLLQKWAKIIQNYKIKYKIKDGRNKDERSNNNRRIFRKNKKVL